MGLNRSPLVNVFSTKVLASVAGGSRARALRARRRERANLLHSRVGVQNACVAGAYGSVQIFTILVHVCKMAAWLAIAGACKSSPFSYTSAKWLRGWRARERANLHRSRTRAKWLRAERGWELILLVFKGNAKLSGA